MYNNIIFIGGIHGVGKSTACKFLSDETSTTYLSASSVLDWEAINEDKFNKKVLDIPLTQDRLVTGLKSIVRPKINYLLDGHFCLFDSKGQVSKVPVDTFIQIAPIILFVVVGEPSEIQNRLNNRDNRFYSLQELEQMQNMEIEYSKFIAELLSIKCYYPDSKNLISYANEIVTSLEINM